MVSEKQISANRNNAAKSTGPKTQQGKIIVSRNALKHGILSKEAVHDPDEQTAFNTFSTDFFETFHPEGQMEFYLVERIINCAWRLARLSRVESLVFKDEQRWGDGSIKGAFTGTTSTYMGILSRYEISLDKCLFRAINELQKMQTKRKETELGLGQDIPVTLENGFVS